MSLVRVRRAAQITLPRDVRKQLDIREDDFFEVHVVDDGLLLKPISFVERRQVQSEAEYRIGGTQDTQDKSARQNSRKSDR